MSRFDGATLAAPPRDPASADRSLVAIGVPWSIHELAPAVRDAKAIGARLGLVDTREALAGLDPTLGIEPIPVGRLAAPDIVRALHAHGADAVVSLTEMTLGLAAEVRAALGLSGNSMRAERDVSDKAATRRLLRENGLTRADCRETTLAEFPALVRTRPLPVVAKPRALTGSTGVQLIEDESDVAALVRQYDAEEAVRHGRDRIVVETFIQGEEVSAEGLAVDGRLTLLALTDKVNTGPPHFFEIGHVMPSRHSADWSAPIADYLQQAIEALGIVTSPIHAELKLTGEGPEMIEIHSRFGGDNIVRLLEEAFGLRAFHAYFSALFDGEAPRVPAAERVCGIGFFTARIGEAYRPESFALPHPGCVAEIEFDARRPAKLEMYEGVRLTYRRLGHCLFVANEHAPVADNLAFLADRLCCVDARSG